MKQSNLKARHRKFKINQRGLATRKRSLTPAARWWLRQLLKKISELLHPAGCFGWAVTGQTG
ncbi:MAG: hypothetical protein ACLFM7_07885 [Bacteroidales bacterium]